MAGEKVQGRLQGGFGREGDGAADHDVGEAAALQIALLHEGAAEVAVGINAGEVLVRAEDSDGAGFAAGHGEHCVLDAVGVVADGEALAGAHDVADPQGEGVADGPARVQAAVGLAGEAEGGLREHGEGVADGEGDEGAGGGGEIKGAGFAGDAGDDGEIRQAGEAVVGGAGEADDGHPAAADEGYELQSFAAFAAVAEQQGDIAVAENAEITVRGFRRMQEDGGRSGAGEGGGDFGPHMVAFAHTGHNQFAAPADTVRQERDGGGDGGIGGLGDAGELLGIEAEIGAGLFEKGFGRKRRIHGVPLPYLTGEAIFFSRGSGQRAASGVNKGLMNEVAQAEPWTMTRLRAQHGAARRAALEAIYRQYNHAGYRAGDPVSRVWRYTAAEDREVMAWMAAALAYGRVASILQGLDELDRRWEGMPARCVRECSAAELRKLMQGFVYRWTRGSHVAGMLSGWQAAGVGLRSALRESADYRGTLGRVRREFLAAAVEDPGHLFPNPEGPGACKRLAMWLRWMARRDEIDPGLWAADLNPARLWVPLDTHMFRIARGLGLTRRRQPDAEAARRITAAFARMCPADPLRYDFGITRIGMGVSGAD